MEHQNQVGQQRDQNAGVNEKAGRQLKPLYKDELREERRDRRRHQRDAGQLLAIGRLGAQRVQDVETDDLHWNGARCAQHQTEDHER
jgi:hypothetical protein